MNIIQIGANKGNDELATLITKVEQPIELLILVEPLSVHNEQLIFNASKFNNIKNIYYENIAITSDNTVNTTTFYYHKNDGPLFEVASINIDHILKHGYDGGGIQKVTVNCMTINQLLDKYAITTLDILFIDAEGIDDTIIYSIDYDTYNIKNIYYEHIHINNDVLCNFLKSKNYTIHHNVMLYTSLASKND